MRYVVHSHINRIVRDELKLDIADFRKAVGVSLVDLHHRSLIVDKELRAISDLQAEAIDGLIGRVVSFAPPPHLQTAHGRQRRVFDLQRIRGLMERTGISAASLSRVLGRQPGWFHLRFGDPTPLRVSEANYKILDALCSSNEAPVYAEGETAPSSCAIAECADRAHKMAPIVRAYCTAMIPVAARTDPSAIDAVPKWRKILHVLARLSALGMTFVDENTLIVEAWRAYPKEFGLRGYESFYPEGREIRTKLISSPLTKYVQRNDALPAQWRANQAGRALVLSPRARETRRHARVLLESDQTCARGLQRSCDDTIVMRHQSTPSPISTTSAKPTKPPILAPFIANSKNSRRP